LEETTMLRIAIIAIIYGFLIFLVMPLVFLQAIGEKITWQNIKKIYYILFKQ